MDVIEMSGKCSFTPEPNCHPVKQDDRWSSIRSVNIGSSLNRHVVRAGVDQPAERPKTKVKGGMRLNWEKSKIKGVIKIKTRQGVKDECSNSPVPDNHAVLIFTVTTISVWVKYTAEILWNSMSIQTYTYKADWWDKHWNVYVWNFQYEVIKFPSVFHV